MTIIFVLFIGLTIVLLFPSQLFSQKKSLEEVDASLSLRLEQLKSEFQSRTRELARRLKSGELAEEEWQQMSQELQLDTAASIESTQLANVSKKTHTSLITGLLMIGLVALSTMAIYSFSESNELAKKQMSIISQLNKDPDFITKLSEQAETENSQEVLESLFMALRSKVDLNPEDVNSWRALAMFNSRVGRNEDAYQALRKAIKLDPSNIDIQVELAQFYASSKEENDILKANSMLISLIKNYPQHEGARLVFAFNSFSLGLYQQAVDSWQFLLNKRGADSQSGKMLQKSIDFALQKMANVNNEPVITAAESTEENANRTENPEMKRKSEIKVSINISAETRQQLSGNESLFVFAKAVNGPNFPLAVVKLAINQIPNEILLSDLNAMQPEFGLSKFSEVNVSARISKSGNAISQEGDINSQIIHLQAPYEQSPITLNL